MADLTDIYPGVEVIDVSTPTTILTPYGVCVMLVSASSGTPQSLKEVYSLEAFRIEYGSDSDSDKYVKSFFSNLSNPNVRLMIFRVNKKDVDDTPLPATLQNWLDAFDLIDPAFNPGGLIICPEAFESLTANADRVKIVKAMDEFCTLGNESYWQSIADLGANLTSLSEAINDRNTYISNKGNVSVYTPAYYNIDDELVLPSAAMAAISLSIWATGAYYMAPAGHKYPIKGCEWLSFDVPKSDYALAHDSGLNLIRYFNNVGYLPYDCVTLSSATEYLQIPSVVCFKVVAYLLSNELISLVFQPLKGAADLVATAEASINRVLFSCWQSGYLVGQTIEDAYEVKQINAVIPSPDNATLSYEVAVRPAYSIIKYRVFLSNLLSIRILA